MSKQLIFVYGTLLRGLENSHRLQSSTFKFRAVTRDQFYMISNESNGVPTENNYEPSGKLEPQDPYRYPYLMKKAITDSQGTPSQIIGEVYEVNSETLAELDVLEEHPTVYRRQEIAVLPTEDIDEEIHCTIQGYLLEGEEVIRDLRSNMESGRYKIVHGGSWAAYVKST